MQWLVTAAKAYVEAKDVDGGTALMKAAANGEIEACVKLVELGANPNLADRVRLCKRSCLCCSSV